MRSLILAGICFLGYTGMLIAQKVKKESKEVVRQEIQLGDLRGVHLGISADIHLTKGTQQKIVLEGQQSDLDRITREVNNGVWRIQYDKNVMHAQQVDIYITLAERLEEIAVSGSGSITGTNTFDNLKDLQVQISGSGEITLDIAASGPVQCALSGSGDITLAGVAPSVEVAISGSGDVDTQKLRTKNCEVSISGSGDATVYCSESIEASISGSGDVSYAGNPSVERTVVRGSGDVEKID